MDKLKKLSSDLTLYNFFWLFIGNLFGIGTYITSVDVLRLNNSLAVAISILVALLVAAGLAKLLVLASTQALKAVWQAIWHISPNGSNIAAPNTDMLTHGRDLATALVRQIYDLSGGAPTPKNGPAPPLALTTDRTGNGLNLAEYLPMPIIGLDAAGKIGICNKQAATFIGRSVEDCIGKPLYDAVQISFQEKNTLDSWITNSKANTATATAMWDRVKLQLPDDKGIRQFDMAARYMKDDPSGYEIVLAFFDHSDRYATEDNSTSYVALAVHELRTPLTVLRGYIEVFEEELDSQLTPELRDFMHKMSASAQTLTAFVSNILNVARVDQNQLNLSLHEANWNELLPQIVKDLQLRAKVRGKTIELDMAPDLPSIAVDKVSIYEVVSNLVDNAVKYSGDSETILVHAHSKDGGIETVVEDHGVGIPASVVDHLFTKFYRSHRSKSKVGGSGLGLYLAKAIVTAHGGQVWVQSKEGEGSSFGFTLQPYTSMQAELKEAPGGNIEREAHGWIKNHSMYRR
ncbi:hypothetical protein BH10PAT3_BH10PAT3_2350 [soil metagenome]